MKELIKINLFKDVCITYKGIETSISKKMGKKLINLFEYLVLNNGKTVSNTELQENLWPETDDAREVIKYAVFRFRKAINEIDGFDSLDLIDTTSSGYSLSNKYDYEIDAAILLDFYKKNKYLDSYSTNKYEEALKILDLYKGKIYLPNNSSMSLVISAREYNDYYVDILSKASEYLLDKEDYQKVIDLNTKAIKIDQLDEKPQYYYIKGLLGNKEYHSAIKHYDEVRERRSSELGIELSNKFDELYSEIRKNTKEDYEEDKDLTQIEAELNRNIKTSGGFYCTFDMFSYLYENIVRSAERSDIQCFLVLFSVKSNNGVSQSIKISNNLAKIIERSIRLYDVFTKINDHQFLAIFASNSVESVYKIIDRIVPKFYAKYDNKKYRLNYDVKKIEQW